MNLRRVPPLRGAEWLVEAVNVGRRDPQAVFGAAALSAVVLYALLVLAVLPVAVGLKGAKTLSPGQAMAVVLPVFLVLTFVLPVLLGGLMHVVRESEAGRAPRARDVFAPLRSQGAGTLLQLGLVQLLINAVGALLVFALAGTDYWPAYFKAVQAAMSGQVVTPPQPANPLLMMLVQLVFNYFSYALMLLCVPLILFSRLGLAGSLRLGLRASVANVGANLLAAVLFGIGLVVVTFVVGLLTLMLAMLAGMLHPLLGALVSLLGYGVLATVVIVVLVAVSYAAWRDTFEGATPEAAAAAAQIEA